MKRLVVISLGLVAAACAPQQPPPPAATAPPPSVAAASPPPPPAPPPQVMPASFDGRYTGTATLGPSGHETTGTTNPICVDNRTVNLTIHNGYATFWYINWKRDRLHYRGKVNPDGTIHVSHLNGDGSRSVFTLHLTDTGASGDMLRGKCQYSLALNKTS